MIKNSTELIKACKEALEKMLSRCLEMGVQPSYYEMYQRGYCDGISDAAEGVPEALMKVDDKGYQMGWKDAVERAKKLLEEAFSEPLCTEQQRELIVDNFCKAMEDKV